MVLTILPARSQNDSMRQIYDQAESEYTVGHIEQAMQILTNNVNSLSGNFKNSAYRLMVLCELAMDNPELAESYAKRLLDNDPYYTPSTKDPARFIDLINHIKLGRSTTITTASSQSEDLSEVPVPTTLITEEMIKNSGARNLQEVLEAYVPGMTIVDCNDDINIAMRGLYSKGQEKILIMLNGHRLNSYCTNIAAPDFSISLEKLKQIEVLRGPASSLYGSVALTAVVNLITKQGYDVDGTKLKLGIGNHGQYRGDMLFGKRYFNLDLLVWGSFYTSKGEKVFMPREDTSIKINEGDIIIGGIGDKPTFDVGVSMKYNNLKFLYNTHFSQVISPMTMNYTYSPYSIDLYRTHNGIGPSFATTSHHAELSYSHQLGNFNIKGNANYDNSDFTHYNAITESPTSAMEHIIILPDKVNRVLDVQPGVSRYINGQEQTIGAKLQADWNYINNKTHNGLLTFGVEGNYFKLEDVRYVFGYNYTSIMPENDSIAIMGKGNESSNNAFVQLKHRWGSFILNAGLRYDHKKRYNRTRINEVSPRIALIYLQPKWNLKLSYSKSFIDAPYLYRKSNLFLASMTEGEYITEDLEAETLHSYQLTFGLTEWIKGLNIEVNTFYNRAKDRIFQSILEYLNSGDIDYYGIELSSNYKYRQFSANLVFEWQKFGNTDFVNRYVYPDINIPEFSANAVLSWQATKNLKIHSHINYYGKQATNYLNLSNFEEYVKSSFELEVLHDEYEANHSPEIMQKIDACITKQMILSDNIFIDKDIDARILFDIGASYKIGKFEFDLNIKNLFNKKYYQSGMNTTVIPQRGRWFLFDIGYKF